MFAVALVYFLTVDSSVSHALPVVEQNSAPPQFVVYGVGRAADLRAMLRRERPSLYLIWMMTRSS